MWRITLQSHSGIAEMRPVNPNGRDSHTVSSGISFSNMVPRRLWQDILDCQDGLLHRMGQTSDVILEKTYMVILKRGG